MIGMIIALGTLCCIGKGVLSVGGAVAGGRTKVRRSTGGFGGGHTTVDGPCYRCGGTGAVYGHTCHKCGGTGRFHRRYYHG